MADEGLGHRIWGWIGREFGAPPPAPDGPRDIVPILESVPSGRGRRRANLYVFRGQLAEAQSLIDSAGLDDDPGQVP